MNSRTSTVDVGRLIGEGPWSGYQKLVLGLAALAFCLEGMASQVFGPALPALTRALGVPRSSFASAAALGLVGFAIGAAGGGALADRFGRRPTLISSLLVFGLATVGLGFSRTVTEFGAWRIAAGFGLGAAIPVAATLIADFTPVRHRSVAIAIGVTFLPLGGFLSGLIAAGALARHDWRALFFVAGGIPTAAAFVLLPTLPESPRFLVRRPMRQAMLRRVLKRCAFHVAPDAILIDGSATSGGNSLRALFEEGRGRDTVPLWAAYFTLLLAMYSLFSWGPAALVAKGFSLAAAGGALSSFAAGSVAGNAVSGWLTERVGSRWCVVVQATVGTAAAAVLALTNARGAAGHAMVLGALVALGVGLSGSQTLLYALTAHVYPPSIRSTGLGAAVAVGRMGAVLSAYSGVAALDGGGPPLLFAEIAIAAVAMAALTAGLRTQLPDRAERLAATI